MSCRATARACPVQRPCACVVCIVAPGGASCRNGRCRRRMSCAILYIISCVLSFCFSRERLFPDEDTIDGVSRSDFWHPVLFQSGPSIDVACSLDLKPAPYKSARIPSDQLPSLTLRTCKPIELFGARVQQARASHTQKPSTSSRVRHAELPERFWQQPDRNVRTFPCATGSLHTDFRQRYLAIISIGSYLNLSVQASRASAVCWTGHC